MMKPYLKGLHLTMDSWRSKRDADGWRMRNADIDILRRVNDSLEVNYQLLKEAPEWVKPVN